MRVRHDGLATAIGWLAAAIARHERHMAGTEATDEASQQRMMDEMRAAMSGLRAVQATRRFDRALGVPVQRFDRVRSDVAELPPRRAAPGGAWDVAAVFARDGVQEYEDEQGRPVREARPRSEVAKSAALMRGLVVTLQHPGDGTDDDQGAGEVTPQNARQLFHGHVLDATADWPAPGLLGGWARLCTADVQAAAEQGTRECSVGYTAVLRDPQDPEVAHLVAELGPEPGVLHDGTRYDLVQTQITPNHLAVVDLARAGHVARLRLDGRPMKRTIKIDGKSYQIAALLADAAKATALDTAAQTKAKADALEVGPMSIDGVDLIVPRSTIDQVLAMLGGSAGPSMPEPEVPPMDAKPDPMAPPRMDAPPPVDEKAKADAALDAKVLASLARVLPAAQAKVADAVTRQVRDRSELDRKASAVLGDAFAYGKHDDHGVALAVLETLKHPRLEQARAHADAARKGDLEARGSLRTLMDLALDAERDRRDSSGDLMGAVFSVAREDAAADVKPTDAPAWQTANATKMDTATRRPKPTPSGAAA